MADYFLAESERIASGEREVTAGEADQSEARRAAAEEPENFSE